MSAEFSSWHEAHAAAVLLARRVGSDVGLEKPTPFQRWTIKLLPRPENRCGWELRCEVVRPTDPL